MIWTDSNVQIHAHPTAAGPPSIDRSVNTAMFSLDKDQALGLMQEIAKAFGVESVPSRASFDRINVVIENPMVFLKEVE